MRDQLMGVARNLGFENSLRMAYRKARNARRELSGVHQKMVDTYLQSSASKKLHLGCGDNLLDGWLNTDYFPKSPQLLHLDATKPFPFPSDQFDYVFSEHMIEHIPYEGGTQMIRESLRVLKPGGKIRVSTPDMQFLFNLYQPEKSPLHREYIAWAARILNMPAQEDTFVINNFMRCWGHTFIYDQKTLRRALEEAGFVNVELRQLNASTDVALQNLENIDRSPAGFLQLESMTFEGTKGA
jgi:predicted SAM-dependent methyltransferase